MSKIRNFGSYSALFFFCAIIFLSGAENTLAAVLPSSLISLTNEERIAEGLPPLRENFLLTFAAQLKANDMAEKGYFSHISPEGKSFLHWFGQVNYYYTDAGENIAVGFSTDKGVMNGWMNSPSHRANIVKKEYTEIGIATAKGRYKGREVTFVAQLLGNPLILPYNLLTFSPNYATIQ